MFTWSGPKNFIYNKAREREDRKEERGKEGEKGEGGEGEREIFSLWVRKGVLLLGKVSCTPPPPPPRHI